MSGWDTSSRPGWDPPEDSAEDTQEQGGSPKWQPAPAGLPPAFSSDYGPRDFGGSGADPGAAPPDRPTRVPPAGQARSSFGQDGTATRDGRYGDEGGYGQEAGYPRGGYGTDNGYGQDGTATRDGRYGQEAGYPRGGYGQEAGYPRGGYGTDNGYGRRDSGSRDRQQPGPGESHFGFQERRRPDFGQADSGSPDRRRPGFRQPDFGAQDPGHPDFGFPDLGDPGFGRPGPGFRDRDRVDRASQQWRGQQTPPAEDVMGTGFARMDPALQDFFGPAPPPPDTPGQEPPFGTARRADGWEDPEEGPRDYDPRDPWGPPEERGPRSGPQAAADRTSERITGGSDRQDGGGRRGRIIAVGAVAALVVVVGAILLTHKSPGSSGANAVGNGQPTGSASTSAAHKSKSKATSSGPHATGGYTLATPATAGGYPMGQDPIFLGMAKKTATQILTAMHNGGGGKAAGKTVSASYRMPAQQVMEFVGYQGTFNPGKISTLLGGLGADQNTYPAGPHGGVLGCANTLGTAANPSGAVCVWATAATLGVVEFFDVSGPETLTSTVTQSRGAQATVNLRSGVEIKS